MTEETIELLINALKEEIVQLRNKPPVVIKKPSNDRPGPWCSREQATRYFSIPNSWLDKWVIAGKVIAKKFDPYDSQSAIRFKTDDIEKAYASMPDYKLTAKRALNKSASSTKGINAK